MQKAGGHELAGVSIGRSPHAEDIAYSAVNDGATAQQVSSHDSANFVARHGGDRAEGANSSRSRTGVLVPQGNRAGQRVGSNQVGRHGVRDGSLRTVDSVSVGQIFLGTRYLRVLDGSPNGLGRRNAIHPISAILCANGSCRNVLSYTDMILDCNRRWSLADGAPERAMFMNALCEGSYVARNFHEHRLAQGLFDMADVHCKACIAQVGYAFIRDKSEEKRNVNQVGRFGLVCSRVRLEAGSEVYVSAGCQRYSAMQNAGGYESTVHTL